MGLRVVSRTAEEANNLDKRFGIAQDTSVVDEETRQEQLSVQASVRREISATAAFIDHQVADSREKSLALTHLEEALMWAGKAIFS